MKSKLVKKIIAFTMIVISTISVAPMKGVNAEWRQDNTGWWNTEGSSYSTGWRNINNTWYYFGQDGYMQTGWLNDNGTWYYTSSTGAMQTGVVKVDNKVYSLGLNGEMQKGNVVIEGQTYTFSESGECISSEVPKIAKEFAPGNIDITTNQNANNTTNNAGTEQKNDTEKVNENNNKENSTTDTIKSDNKKSKSHHSHKSSNNNETTPKKEDITITSNEDISKLDTNISYGTVTINTLDEEINLNNIKADNLVIDYAEWINFDNCNIGSTIVNNGDYPCLELGDKCNFRNVTFNCAGRIDEDVRFNMNVISKVCVNTTDNVQIIGIVNNVEVLKSGSNVRIGGFESIMGNVLIKESSYVNIDCCKLKKLILTKQCDIEVTRSEINELENNDKLIIILAYSTINNLINNSTEKVNIDIEDNSGIIKNIKEIEEGSVIVNTTTSSAVKIKK
ncbi:hypothetical protein FC789_15645 [Clostridium botulinum]|nr:hypothetical protein [Clostridium botulinum]